MYVYIKVKPNYITGENQMYVEVEGIDSYGNSVTDYDIITREMLLAVLGDSHLEVLKKQE
jgi:hypothetical protein